MSKTDSYKRLHGKACRDCWDFTDGPDEELCEWCKQTPEQRMRMFALDLVLVVIVALVFISIVAWHVK